MADEPRTKEALIARINECWDELQQLVSGLNSEQLEAPLGDGWSAKVHLAHLAAWETSTLALLSGDHRGDAMGVPRETWNGHGTDAINAVIAERADLRPATEVFSESQATHIELLALLRGMSQDDLEKSYSHYQPHDMADNPAPVVGWVHGNTWDHYNEHIGWLKQGINAQ